jgi:hypothetical protein
MPSFAERIRTFAVCWIGNMEPEKFGATKLAALWILRSPQTNFELDQSPMGFLKVAL